MIGFLQKSFSMKKKILPISRSVSPGVQDFLWKSEIIVGRGCRGALIWEGRCRCIFAPIMLLFCSGCAPHNSWGSCLILRAYERVFSPLEKGEGEKSAVVARRRVQEANLQVHFCADEATFLLRLRGTQQLRSVSGFQGPTMYFPFFSLFSKKELVFPRL